MERYESSENKKVLVLEDGEKVLKTMADSLRRKESVLNIINSSFASKKSIAFSSVFRRK